MKRLLSITGGPASPATHPLESGLDGFLVEQAAGRLHALNQLAASLPDVVLVHCPIPDWAPEDLLEEIHRLDPLLPVCLHVPHLAPTDAVRLARFGAWQCLDDSASPEEWAQMAEDAAEEARTRRLAARCPARGEEPWKRFLVGESRAIRDLEQIVRLVAARRSTVLITGETGTGKEMLARALHLASPRARYPMVSVNCGALPQHLLEAELFGHVKGAFTGAIQSRVGRFEQAHRSTLFLDEIGDLPLDLQVKLLRVLQEREFERLGSSEPVQVDVRVIAASNRNLPEMVRQGQFREDLFYRLNVVPVHIQPLRERLSDIPLLVHHFVEKICRADDLPPRRVTPEALDRLLSHSWPGNVRELENCVEMAVAMSGERAILHPSDFPLRIAAPVFPENPAASPALPPGGIDFEGAVREFEQSLLQQALQQAGGNKTLAAELLGLKRTTLLAKLRNLEPPAFLPASPGPGLPSIPRRRAAAGLRLAAPPSPAGVSPRSFQDCSSTSRWTLRSNSTSF